jgi:hypothetical protein
MKDRCLNPNSKYWGRYGGVGKSVCDEWANDFVAFYEWSVRNGYDETLTLDRIDNSKGYSPENCRWVTYSVQENNRTNNVLYEVDGIKYTLAQLCRKDGLSRKLAEKKYKENKIWETK